MKNFNIFVHLASIFVALLVRDAIGQQPEVDIPDFGTIYGETIPFKSDYPAVDTHVNAYRGIPFAKNASHYRFMKPEPLESLEDGWLNATAYSSICWQLPEVLEGESQSEDCLYLNIWTPHPQPTNAPVMVWFHGGGFVIGSSSKASYEGHALCGYHGVILVNTNYRLNGFGFLSTGDDVLPGMYGMYDQLEALKWVNKHITAFGGDPDQVTIFGQSAGAGSVGLHLLAQESEQYFKRAILVSGTATSPWAVETDASKARDDAFGVGEAASCPDLSTSEALAQCLRDLPEKTLTFAIDRILLETTNVIPFVPTVDGMFLVDNPLNLVKANRFKKCPILLGATKDDGSLVAGRAFIRQINTDEGYANKTEFRDALERFTYTYVNDVIIDAIMQEYVDWTLADDPQANYFYDYIAVETDEAFTCPSVDFARYYAEDGQDVYLYDFTHLPNQTVWTSDLASPEWRGVAHAEDLQFIFGYHFNPSLTLWDNMPLEEVELTVDIMRYYTNFAKTGNPNLETVGGQPNTSSKAWPKFSLPDLDYKILNPAVENSRGLKARECNFWNKYLPSLVIQSMDLSDLEEEWREDYNRWKTEDMVEWQAAFEDYKSNTQPCN
ncbi:acetylcholinesterase-like [Lytechinus variegatus]|uniref:acetylcholinesterase-like n=1 Tax=Lytechinus variegatus TaxID=7654 RepID=UPI001BB2567B|nr:acetylcholinesterase-like [Lytechinus variegatus]